jgi:hypothetical protein
MDATFGPAPTSSTVANSGAGGSEGWASFDDMNKVKDGGQGQEGWADFTSFDKMSGGDVYVDSGGQWDWSSWKCRSVAVHLHSLKVRVRGRLNLVETHFPSFTDCR